MIEPGRVRKAVLPVAGLGTRFLPASKAIPKEMITVVDKPVVQYVVEEALAAGISEIVLVTHGLKKAIEDHFDVHYELEATLKQKGKQALLETLSSIVPAGVRIISVRQGRPLGLGHAVLCAREVIGDEPFAVLLPDVLVEPATAAVGNDLQQMIAAYGGSGQAQIMVEPVAAQRVDQYGIVDLEQRDLPAGQSAAMRAIVEKPALAEAPSNLAVVGRYVLPPQLFTLLEATRAGAGGEIQLTDAIAALIRQQTVAAYRMGGQSFDCGSKLGYLAATLHYASQHPQLGDAFRAMLRDAAAANQ